MNKDRFFIVVVATLLVIGVTFLCISLFGNRDEHHLLPIAMACICSANALIVAINIKRKKSNNTK